MMEERVLKFILALRSRGVRISLAESADAFRSIEELGVKDRELFRICLRSTLIKDQSSISTFEELFPLFFGTAQEPPLLDPWQDLTDQEADWLAKALERLAQELRASLERLLHGDPLSESELKQLASQIGLQGVQDLRFRDWMAKRMQNALQFRQVREALDELMKTLAELGMELSRVTQLGRAMQANLDSLEDQIRSYIGERIVDQIAEGKPQDSQADLFNRPFHTLTEEDMKILRREVRRLAIRLRTRITLRQRRSRTGLLDAKATIRANLKHGNVPMILKHRDRRLRPRLVVICDISTSMRHLSELMLSLVYNLQDQVRKTHAFAFIDHLEYISPSFERTGADEAVAGILDRMPSGYYNTDLGRSLDNFVARFLDTVNYQSTLIIVGDGRNNYNDPRLDLFNLISRRSNRTIWINPEHSTLWGVGDSDMRAYLPYCDHVLRVNNLSELSQAVDRLFE
jgi:uncharacterized protein